MSALTDAYNQARQSNPDLTLQEFQSSYKYSQPAPQQQSPAQPAPMGFQRDQSKEQSTLSKLGLSEIQGMQLSDNPVFKKNFLEMTYGDQAKNLQEYQQLAANDQERQGIGSQMAQIRQNAPNAMLALEDALRTKVDVGNQQIGESDLYKKAGLEGIFTLNKSLSENSRQMQDRYGSFVNALSRAGQFQANQYRGLADQYKVLTDEYNQKQQEMTAILNQAQQYNEAIGLAEQEFDLWKREQEFLRSQGPDPETIAEWRGKGYEYIDGEYVPADSFDAIFGTVGNPSDQFFGECGYFSNRATNAKELGKWVGDSWGSKIAVADTIVRKSNAGVIEADSFNFEAGNTLFVPIGQYGHTAVITGYNPVTGDISVVERNANLDGQTMSGVYNVYDMQNQYDEWGVAKTSFKNDIKNKLVDTGMSQEDAKSSGGGADITKAQPTEILDFQRYLNDGKFPYNIESAEEKEQFKNNFNEFIGYIKSNDADLRKVLEFSIGGKSLTQGEKERLLKYEMTSDQLKDLENMIMDTTTDPLLGILRNNIPYDDKAKAIKAKITSLVPSLARGVYGEVGVLTDSDVERYTQTLPNLKSTSEQKEMLIDMTQRMLQRGTEQILKNLASGGNDVSSYGYLLSDDDSSYNNADVSYIDSLNLK